MERYQLSIPGPVECDPEILSEVHYRERSPPVIVIQILAGVGRERKTKANYLTKIQLRK